MLYLRTKWPEPARAFLKEWDDPEVSFFEMKTTGSTGTSKSVTLSREFMTAAALSSQSVLGWRKGQRTGLALSAEGIGGKMILVRSRIFEMEVVPLRLHLGARLPDELTEVAFDSYLHHLSLVPVQAAALLRAWRLAGIKPELRLGMLLVGGGPMVPALEEEISLLTASSNPTEGSAGPNATGFGIYQGFGMTETAGHFALRSLYPRLDTSYMPLSGVTVSVESGQSAPERSGNLVLHGMANQPQALPTREWVRLVDLPDGNTGFIWLGRSDLVMQSGGHTLITEDLELQLRSLTHPPACMEWVTRSDWFLAPVPDPHWGQKVGLCLSAELWDMLVAHEFEHGGLHLHGGLHPHGGLHLEDFEGPLPPHAVPRVLLKVPASCFAIPSKILRPSEEQIRRFPQKVLSHRPPA